MSDTMSATGAGQVSVHSYVEQVRAALADLPPEEVEDLTIGLEADLTERLAEPGVGLGSPLPDPLAYAAELRAAAGLPPRVLAVPPRPSLVDRALAAWRHTAERHPWVADLRPIWWVARAAAAAWLVTAVVGGRSVIWLLVAVFGIGSFVIGRVSDDLPVGPKGLVLAGNLLAAILLVPAAASLLSPAVVYADATYGSDPAQALSMNGETVTNLYAFDADGNRLDRVRLFNQYGQAVALDGYALEDWNGQHPEAQIPVDPTTGELAANRAVFPVRWGTRTGWETSTGMWAPPVQITALDPVEGGTGDGANTSPSEGPIPTSTTSPSAGAPAATSPTPSRR